VLGLGKNIRALMFYLPIWCQCSGSFISSDHCMPFWHLLADQVRTNYLLLFDHSLYCSPSLVYVVSFLCTCVAFMLKRSKRQLKLRPTTITKTRPTRSMLRREDFCGAYRTRRACGTRAVASILPRSISKN